MKITARQTNDFLNRPSQTFGCLVYGPDDGLVLRHSRQIVRRILGEHYDPMSLIELGDSELKDDPARLADECGAMSLMGGKRLVWIRGAAEKHASLIEPCLSLLGEYCYLLVSAGECAPKNKWRQLFEQHKQLASLACYRAEGRNLSNLIREMMAEHGQNIEAPALQFLTHELGNDAMVTQSELEKLSLYAHGKKVIDLEDARAAIVHNHEHQIDPLCQHFINQDSRHFDELWQYLIRDGIQPIVLIRSLARYTNRLLSLKIEMQTEGFSAHEAVDRARPPIFWNQKDAMTRQLAKLTTRHLMYYLHLLNQAECSFKLHSYAGDMGPERVLLSSMTKMKMA